VICWLTSTPRFNMLFPKTLGLLATLAFGASATPIVERQSAPENYEYIVVGAGAGGGPLAARLAIAGHSVLLIDAGDDGGSLANYTVPAYQARSTEDPELGWEFYVRHYSNDTQEKRNFKLSYDTPDGGVYTGLDPPEGSTIKGVYYPRSAQLGGCTGHNALVTIYPDKIDFQNIVNTTGDQSWAPANMRKYWVNLEDAIYLPAGQKGHGYKGWLGVETAPVTLALGDPQLFSQINGAVVALGNGSSILPNYLSVLGGDANKDSTSRDENQALYQIPIASRGGQRNGAREFILETANAVNSDGSKKYPLYLQVNTYVTKVTFDQSVSPPAANGVEWLEGRYLYRASINKPSGSGVAGGASATREVIVAGGSYNSPQILKLSGVGPREELESFNITVIADVPGVGKNLQDHYETVVQGTLEKDFSILDGCTFGWAADYVPTNPLDDPCYVKWLNAGNSSNNRGVYASSGFAAAMFIRTTDSPDNDYDLLAFGGPVNFRGYFPDYSYYATNEHNWFSWAILKSHPRNHAGELLLRSADPLDTPYINFHYYEEGGEEDLDQQYQAIEVARAAFANQSYKVTEVLPGPNVTTREDVYQYLRDTTWGHHCSGTVPIGADDDPDAVLDSSFRVRGVTGLRVADASVFKEIPGTFTAASTYLVGEKAADVILSQFGQSSLTS